MSQVGLVRRWDGVAQPAERLPTGQLRPSAEVIAIGASAGGPSALRTLLGALPTSFSIPIVIVQHMPEEFLPGLARWLAHETARPVQLVTADQPLRAGRVYLAGGHAHLAVQRVTGSLFAVQTYDRGAYRYQPAIDVLFESVAAACGGGSVGIVLTGMGDDGAAGLLAMRQAGALTIAQDEDSATVFGMPGAAIRCGAVEHVLALSNLANTLSSLI
jgi:two-component system chemotaxis response regulator CheB